MYVCIYIYAPFTLPELEESLQTKIDELDRGDLFNTSATQLVMIYIYVYRYIDIYLFICGRHSHYRSLRKACRPK